MRPSRVLAILLMILMLTTLVPAQVAAQSIPGTPKEVLPAPSEHDSSEAPPEKNAVPPSLEKAALPAPGERATPPAPIERDPVTPPTENPVPGIPPHHEPLPVPVEKLVLPVPDPKDVLPFPGDHGTPEAIPVHDGLPAPIDRQQILPPATEHAVTPPPVVKDVVPATPDHAVTPQPQPKDIILPGIGTPSGADAANQNDCGVGADAGNDFNAAHTVTVPVSGCSGQLTSTDTNDYFKFSVSSGATITSSMTPNSAADYDLCLYRPDGSQAQCSTNGGATTDSVSFQADATGQWRVRVLVWSGSGTYSLSISATTPQNDCGIGGDAGNAHASASTITLPKSNCSGSLANGETEDWFKFSVSSGSAISSSMTPNSASDFDLCVYRPDGSEVQCSTQGGAATETVNPTANVAGEWRVRVVRWSGSGSYTLSVSATSAQNDCGTGTDAGGSHGAATSITLPKSGCSASFPSGTGDVEDWYKFSVSSGQAISSSMSPNSGADYDLCLYRPDGSQAQCSTQGGAVTEAVSFTANVAGDWRVRVYVWSGTGSYTLSVSTSSPQNDCSIGGDAGNNHGAASSITLPKSNCQGSFPSGTGDVEDWYKFSVTSGQGVTGSMAPNAAADYDLCLYRPDGSQAQCSTQGGAATEAVSFTADATGDWRLRVNVWSGTGTYTLSASVSSPQNDCSIGGDAGNSHSGASSITLPKNACSASFPANSGDTEDWYKFSISSGQTVNGGMTPNSAADYDLCLYRPDGSQAACSTNGGSTAESVSFPADASGDWRARVYVWSGSGTYTLTLSATTPQNDCGIGGDAGNNHGAASSITLPKSNCQGSFPSGTGDVEDWYKFSVNNGQSISASMTPSVGNDFDLCLYRPDGSQAQCSTQGGAVGESVTFTANVGGDWRLRVNVWSGAGTYTLSASLTTPQNDCGSGTDAGNAHSAALAVTPPVSNCQGSFPAGSGDTSDWYKFTVVSGQSITTSMTPNAAADYDLCLYRPDGTQVQCSTQGGAATETVTHTATASGDYRAAVTVWSGSGTYTFSVSTSTPQNDCGIGTDAGNTHSGASAITLPKSNCQGSFPASSGDAEDWYKFPVTSGQTITASMTPNPAGDYDLCLYRPDGAQVVCSTNGGATQESISRTADASGDWRLRVYVWSGSGTYTLSASTAIPQNDCGTGADAGNNHGAASAISPPVNCQGAFPSGAGDTEDWYKFSAANGVAISASMTPASGADYDLCVYRPDGSQAQCSTNGGTTPESVSYTANAAGDWRVRVYVWSGTGTYSLAVSLTTPQNDCGTGVDAGNTHAQATSITLPVSNCQGAFPVGSGDVEDWYKFNAAVGQAITASMTPVSTADYDLCLYRPDGSQAQCSTQGGATTETVTHTANVAGDWRVRVNVWSGSGTYALSASTTAPQNDCGTGTDAGNSFGAATSITPPVTSCQGALSANDAEDWYKFNANSGQAISASMTSPSGADFDLCLYRPDGTQAQCSATSGPEQLTHTATATGQWRVRVYVWSGSGTYAASVGFVTPQNDCGTSTDAGNTFDAATRVTPPVSNCQGSFPSGAGDVEDWFKFAANAGTTITASMTPNSAADYDLCLYRPDGTQARCSTYGGSSTESVAFPANVGGDWRVRVNVWSGTGTYTLTVTTTIPQNDCGIGGDAGGSHSSANTVLPPLNCQGSFPAGSGDAEDWYKFTASAGQGISASMTPPSGADFDLCLYRPDGSQARCNTLGGSSPESLSHTAESAGDWRIRVSAWSGTGTYGLTASVSTPQNDCGIGGDAGNTHSGASTLGVPASGCTGSFPASTGDTADWYKFTVANGQTISASMTPNSAADYDLCLYSPTDATNAARCSTFGGSATESISHQATAAGEWRLRVFVYGGTGTYTMGVNLGTPQNDCGVGSDAGNSHATASTITPPVTSCQGALPAGTGDTEDWYKFNANSGQTITASMTPPSGADFDLCLYRPDGTQAQCSTLGGVTTEGIAHTASVTGQWRLRVYQFAGTGAYTASVTVSNSAQNDCGKGVDAGNTHSQATTIAPPISSCTGQLATGSGDGEDWYKFPVTNGQTVTATMTPGTGTDFDLCLYSPSNQQMQCSTLGGVNTERIQYTVATTGDWRLRVYPFAGSGTYTLGVTVTTDEPNDCTTGGDAGNSFNAAAPVFPPVACTGAFPTTADREDWYRFNAATGANIGAAMTPALGQDFDLCLYRPAGGNPVACSTLSGSGTETIEYVADATGDWRVRVYAHSGSGGYTASISAPVPPAVDAYYAHFDDGLEGWTTTGMWHHTVMEESSWAEALSPPGSAWFGREETGTYENGNLAASGDLTSPPINLRGIPNPMLMFGSWYETEDTGTVLDTKKVYVSTNDGATWTLLGQVSGDADYERWAIRFVDLTPYAQNTIRLRFEFGTADAFHNNYRGWFVDDVRIFRDDDHDALSLEEENRQNSNPNNPDTDGDLVRDTHDPRPTLEDIAPWFPYPEGEHVGSVYVRNDAGVIDVEIRNATDGAGGSGVRAMDMFLELSGTAAGAARKATLGFELIPIEQPGGEDHWMGRQPLPKIFEGGTVTNLKVILVPSDANGNKRPYVGQGAVDIDFHVPWTSESDPEFWRLERADVEEGTADLPAGTQTTTFGFNPLVRSAVTPTFAYDGVVGPGESGNVGEFQVTSPRLGGTGDIIPTPPPAATENVLAYVGTSTTTRAAFLDFAGGALNTVWSGIVTGYQDYVAPEVHSFIHGADSNGHVIGDIVSGFVVYGDVRDVVVGAFEGDYLQVGLGAVGLVTTFTGPGDGAYSAAKAAIKVVPGPLAKVLTKELWYVVRNPTQIVELAPRLTAVAKFVGTDAAKADRFLRYSNLFEGQHALLKLTSEADYKSVDAVLAKYGDGVLNKWKASGSLVNDADTFVLAAKAEARFGGNVVGDAADLATVPGAKDVLKNLDTATANSGKGYVYELKKAADRKRAGGTIEEMNRWEMISFRDADNQVRTARYDMDFVENVGGVRVLNEVKDKNYLSLTKGMKNQILKMHEAVNVLDLGDEAKIWVKSGSTVSAPLKAFAKEKGVKIFDDAGVWINP